MLPNLQDAAEEAPTSRDIADFLCFLDVTDYFDEKTRSEIGEMSLYDAFATAYGYLLQAGRNDEANSLCNRFAT